MITIENFGPNNRERRIGNSLYRIYLDAAIRLTYGQPGKRPIPVT